MATKDDKSLTEKAAERAQQDAERRNPQPVGTTRTTTTTTVTQPPDDGKPANDVSKATEGDTPGGLVKPAPDVADMAIPNTVTADGYKLVEPEPGYHTGLVKVSEAPEGNFGDGNPHAADRPERPFDATTPQPTPARVDGLGVPVDAVTPREAQRPGAERPDLDKQAADARDREDAQRKDREKQAKERAQVQRAASSPSK
jgi:hypothetical protein